MRVERDGHRPDPSRRRFLHDAGEDGLVSAVDAVEVPDCNRRGRSGSGIGQLGQHLHGLDAAPKAAAQL
jgi:hypothetical protein